MLETSLTPKQYQQYYHDSIQDPDAFWAAHATKLIDWIVPWQHVMTGALQSADWRFFVGAKLNACYNALDRHLAQHAARTAVIFEGDSPEDVAHLSYQALYEAVTRFANALKVAEVKKGDRICIYLPMIPEAIIAMLAASRIGAVHTVVFAGFSHDALGLRIQDVKAKVVITTDAFTRGGRLYKTKETVDLALKDNHTVQTVFVVKRTGQTVAWQSARDCWYHEAVATMSTDCPPEAMDANDPLFILYTSGSTNRPKGIVHATGGYLVYTAATHRYLFNTTSTDVYWCTADVGWITGHSYVVYGPLVNGATVFIYEGAPTYPTPARFFEMIDRHQISIFYTAPTAIRALRHEGDAWVKKTSRKSLRLLGTVGEPINPDVWRWYHDVVGEKRCPILDTWWQTETGGILIAPFPTTPSKPGAASWPFFGISPAIVDEHGHAVAVNAPGELVIQKPWPGLMQTIYGDHTRMIETYLKPVPGCYFTGDSASLDADGYYWIAGRNDDVIKVSGHRLGTEELESALIAHSAVSEAAVVAVPDEIKGSAIYAYVVLQRNVAPTDALKQVLIKTVREKIGPLAQPKVIHFVADLPKTRSGKIMRRILRKIACGEAENLGDLSTLANPQAVSACTAKMA